MNVEQLYISFENKLRYFIGKRINDSMVAEDILHDVFIKIHEKINTLKNSDKLESWIYQITRNAIVDYYRKEKPHQDINEEEITEKNNDDDDSVHKKASMGLTEFIDELPAIYREALLLTEYEGLTQKELAERINISLTGAKSRVQRAKKMLRNMLLECCHFDYDKYGTVIDYCKVCCCCASAKK